MCIKNPVPFSSDTPIIAYKLMLVDGFCDVNDNSPIVTSAIAGNAYGLGSTYSAEKAFRSYRIIESREYDRGFHAYENLDEAIAVFNFCTRSGLTGGTRSLSKFLKLVKVEISELTFKGIEEVAMNFTPSVLVANKCKFLEIIPVKN